MSADNVRGATFVNVTLLRGINVGGEEQTADEGSRRHVFRGWVRQRPNLHPEWECSISRWSSVGKRHPVRDQWIDLESLRLSRSSGDPHGFGSPGNRAGQFFRGSWSRSGRLHVLFLTDLPDHAHVEALDPNRSPGDEFAVLGRKVFLHCPNGVARSKLTNSYFDSSLSTTSTAGNWRTVGKLLELATADQSV